MKKRGNNIRQKKQSTNRPFLVGFAAALLVAVAVLAVVRWRKPVEAALPAAAASDAAAPMAPDFKVVDLDGKVVRLSDLRGQPVIVNFWATWCPPCRAEIPAFIDLQRRYGPQGLRIVGVAMDDAGPSVVRDFVASNGINYTVAMANSEVVQSYGGVENLPTTFYVGRDGRVVQSITGLVSPETMETHVLAALAAASPAAS